LFPVIKIEGGEGRRYFADNEITLRPFVPPHKKPSAVAIEHGYFVYETSKPVTLRHLRVREFPAGIKTFGRGEGDGYFEE